MRERRLRPASFILAIFLWQAPCSSQDPLPNEYLFALGETQARTGAPFAIPVLADAPVSYQGFSLSVRYPRGELLIEHIGPEGTIVEAIHSDFFHGEDFPELGLFNVAVLVEVLPPFEGTLIPAIGSPLEVAWVSGKVLRRQPGEIQLSFDGSGERPSVQNLFSVDSLPVTPQRLISGKVLVEEPPRVAAFIRGDANLDREIDISDPIHLLGWEFIGDRIVRCEDAADANMDDRLDVADVVYLLEFLFKNGTRPLPPQLRPGPDPSGGGALGCTQPLEWIPGRG